MRAEYLAAKEFMLLLAETYFNDEVQSQVSMDTALGQAIAAGERWIPVRAKKGKGFVFDIDGPRWQAIKHLDVMKDWKPRLLDSLTDAILDSDDFLAELIREVCKGEQNPDYRVTTKYGIHFSRPGEKRSFG